MILRNLFLSLLALTLVSCLPEKKVTQCNSSETFNPTSRRCIASTNLDSNGLSIHTSTPLIPFSYTFGQSFPSKTFNVTIKDPNGTGHSSKWELFGTSSSHPVSYQDSFIFSSTNISSPGTYTLLYTLSTSSGNAVDTRSWTIQATSSTGATIISPSPLTQTISRYSDNITDLNFGINFTNPLSETITLKWFLDGTEYTSDATNSGKNISFDANLFNIPGTYTVEVALTGSQGSSDLKIWTVNVSHPNLPIISAVSEPVGTSHLLVDTIPYGSAFCVTFNDLSTAASGVEVTFYESGAIKKQTTLTDPATQDCYTPTITLMHPQIGESRTLLVEAKDVATGLPISSSIAPTISWNLSIRPKNEAPTARFIEDKTSDEVQCATVGTTAKEHCSIYLNEPKYFTFQVNDSDYDFSYTNGVPNPFGDTDKYQVEYFIDGVPYSCPAGPIGVTSSDKFSCHITFDSFNANGPITPDNTHYVVTAKVTDSSIYSLPAFPGLTSNIVSWDIDTVQINNHESIINPQGGGSELKDSLGNPLTIGTAGISENQILYFHLEIADQEMDNGIVTITRCGDMNCTSLPPYAEAPVSQSLTRTNNINPALLKVPYFLRDDVVTGGLDGNVYFKVEFTDARGGVSLYEIMGLTVNDVNPPPVLANANTVTPTPNLGLSMGVDISKTYYVYPGFPFTINPGSITDSNQYDGNEIIYDWQYSTNPAGPYNSIEGGNTHTLIYSPPKGVTGNVYIKLCVSDNGFDHGDQPKCTDNYFWKLTVLDPKYNILTAPHNIDGEKAIFFDKTDNVLYSAYASSESIYLNKIVYDKEDSPLQETNEIEIKAYEASTGCSPHELSLTGYNDGTSKTTLYLAYLCDDSFGPGAVTRLNIRQINAFKEKNNYKDAGTFGFNYQGWEAASAITVDPTMSLSTVNHRRVISIDNLNSVTSGDKLIFNSTLTVRFGTDICNPTALCPTISAAAEALKNYINNSIDPIFQGTYAERSANQVTLMGVVSNNIYSSATQVRTIGKIKIIKDSSNNPYWYIPIQKAMPYQVSVVQAPVVDYLPSSPIAENVITASNEGFEIDNETSSANEYLIAIKTPNDKVDFYHTTFNNFSVGTYKANIFSPKTAYDIRLAKTTSGANISARDINTNEVMIAHSESDYSFTTVSTEPILAAGSTLQTLFDNNSDYIIKSIDDSHLALLFVSQMQDLYVGKISFDILNSPILTCSGSDLQTCPKINTSSPVANNIVMDDIVLKELGTSGSSVNENKKLILPIVYDNGSNNLSHNLLNVSDETITTEGETYSSMPYIKGSP